MNVGALGPLKSEDPAEPMMQPLQTDNNDSPESVKTEGSAKRRSSPRLKMLGEDSLSKRFIENADSGT